MSITLQTWLHRTLKLREFIRAKSNRMFTDWRSRLIIVIVWLRTRATFWAMVDGTRTCSLLIIPRTLRWTVLSRARTPSPRYFLEKQTKNRNEKGSNLSLGTRLTVLFKRLGRKRCCDTTPDRCLECNRLTILTSHC